MSEQRTADHQVNLEYDDPRNDYKARPVCDCGWRGRYSVIRTDTQFRDVLEAARIEHARHGRNVPP